MHEENKTQSASIETNKNNIDAGNREIENGNRRKNNFKKLWKKTKSPKRRSIFPCHHSLTLKVTSPACSTGSLDKIRLFKIKPKPNNQLSNYQNTLQNINAKNISIVQSTSSGQHKLAYVAERSVMETSNKLDNVIINHVNFSCHLFDEKTPGLVNLLKDKPMENKLLETSYVLFIKKYFFKESFYFAYLK